MRAKARARRVTSSQIASGQGKSFAAMSAAIAIAGGQSRSR
jgi:hypothetical protein